MAAEQHVQVTQHRSANGANPRQRETLRSLGLGRIGRTAEHRDGPALRGMVKTVEHLVSLSGEDTGERKGGRRR